MTEDFVPFEIAKKLKEKGFREECLCHYIGEDLVYNIESPIANNQLWFCHNKYDNIWHKDNVDAPTISQVLKWLREEKRLHIDIAIWKGQYIAMIVFVDKPDPNVEHNNETIWEDESGFESYEQAALLGIEYVLDNLI